MLRGMTSPRHFDARPDAHYFYATLLPESVRLDPSNPKWVQLCAAGDYVYRGQPIKITTDTLDRMIANFRAHPAFDAGARQLFGKPLAEAAKLGAAITSGVIALNFDHPPPGMPRPGHGWFLDVERRGDQLWGLCWFDAEAHAGMLALRWKWTSIEWTEDDADNQGRARGPYLSGVALTNDPFITGMQPIQMSQRCGCGQTFASPLPAPLLTPDEQRYLDALTEQQVQQFAAYPWEKCIADQKKAGHSEESSARICGSIKAKNAARLAARSVSGTLPNGPTSANIPGAHVSTQEIHPMTTPAPAPTNTFARTFASRLSAKLGRAVGDDEAAVLLAFDAYGNQYDQLMAVASQLKQLLGTEDPAEIVDKLTALAALKEQMAQILPQMAAAEESAMATEAEMAAQDVQQVMAAQRLDPAKHPGTVKAYLAQRLGGLPPLVAPTAAEFAKSPAVLLRFMGEQRARREARPGLRKAFLAAHGIDAMVPVPAHLQHIYGTTLFAGDGAVFGVNNNAPPPAANQGQGQHPYNGAPLAGQGVPSATGYTWARVALLPPPAKGDNYLQRIFDEVVRAEFAGDARGSRYEQAWKRANALASELIRREGPPPSSLLTVA